MNAVPCCRVPWVELLALLSTASVAFYSSCKKAAGHSCQNPYLCSLIQVLPGYLTRDLMGFSKWSRHIRGRILVESESYLTDHCALVVTLEHTYVFKQVHAFVNLKTTTAKLGKRSSKVSWHSLHIQKMELLVALFVGNLQLCFLLHYWLLYSAQKMRNLKQNSEFTIFQQCFVTVSFGTFSYQ